MFIPEEKQGRSIQSVRMTYTQTHMDTHTHRALHPASAFTQPHVILQDKQKRQPWTRRGTRLSIRVPLGRPGERITFKTLQHKEPPPTQHPPPLLTHSGASCSRAGALGCWGLDFGLQKQSKVPDGEFQTLCRASLGSWWADHSMESAFSAGFEGGS